MIIINKKYDSEEERKNLNNLIKETVELNNKIRMGYNEYLEKIQYIDLFLINLSNKTNLEKELNRFFASINDLDFNKIFSNLKTVSKDNLTDSLLEELNLDLNRIKNEDEKIYNFIFPINIISKKCIDDFVRFHNVNFEDIFNLFGIELVDPNNYRFFKTEFIFGDHKDSKKCINDLMNPLMDPNKYRGLLLEVNINSRSLAFAREKAVRKMEIFLGFLSFSQFYLSNTRSFYSSFQKDKKLEISSISSYIYFVFENRVELIHPFYYVIDLKGRKELLSHWEMKKDEIIQSILELPSATIDSCSYVIYELFNIFNDNNLEKKLKENLENSLILYYYACEEKMLDYSFLKFWMISELIIKKAGSITDKTVATRMVSVIKSNVRLPTERFLDEEIHFLQRKRNALVHDGNISNISQYDRKLSKLIADSVLRLFIQWIPEIRDIHGFSFVLKNLRQDYDNLIQYSEIIKKMKTPDKYLIELALDILKNYGYKIESSEFKKEIKERIREKNDIILNNIEKQLIGSGWISTISGHIEPTNKILHEYDSDVLFLISKSGLAL